MQIYFSSQAETSFLHAGISADPSQVTRLGSPSDLDPMGLLYSSASYTKKSSFSLAQRFWRGCRWIRLAAPLQPDHVFVRMANSARLLADSALAGMVWSTGSIDHQFLPFFPSLHRGTGAPPPHSWPPHSDVRATRLPAGICLVGAIYLPRWQQASRAHWLTQAWAENSIRCRAWWWRRLNPGLLPNARDVFQHPENSQVSNDKLLSTTGCFIRQLLWAKGGICRMPSTLLLGSDNVHY